jgi:hypothetical protein
MNVNNISEHILIVETGHNYILLFVKDVISLLYGFAL